MAAFGVDYAFSPHASVSQLKAAGAKFACRYISSDAVNDTNGKNLTPGEATALRDAGIEIVLVVEEGAGRMLSGSAAGVADAEHADAVVKALGMTGMPVYFACDFDATPAQQGTIDAYLDGAAGVIGRARVGIYGGYWPCVRAWKSGKVSYVWQTYAWSGDNVPFKKGDIGGLPRHIFQYSNGRTIAGASVDFDQALWSDFGQWPRPGKTNPDPIPTPVKTATAVRHVADGTVSIQAVADARNVDVYYLILESWFYLDDDNQKAMALYLAFPGRDQPMPRGLVYWTSH